MKNKVKIKWYPGTQQKLLNAPNVITYTIARQTLDRTYPHIPKDTGKMRATSMSAGVRGSFGKYHIGSYTRYAKRVWFLPKTTNWSEPGSFGKWYQEIWKKQKKNIIASSVERNKMK